MELNLKNKTALVTASSGGIGMAIAKSLAKEGAMVYVNGRNEENVLKAIAEIKSEIKDASLKPAIFDASNKQGREELIKKIEEVDILVNNLGIYEEKEFSEITEERWHEFFDINVLSGITLAKNYLPKMKQKGWGRIIFIASESGIMIPSEMIHYGLTKTCNLASASGIARLTKSTGVTVNSVLPGPTLTEGVKVFVEQMAKKQGKTIEETTKDFFKTVRPNSLLERFIDPAEIANVVTFIASPLSSAINGAAIRAEGGIVNSII